MTDTSIPPRPSRLARLIGGLSRTRRGFVERLRTLTGAGVKLDEERIEQIEEILLGADCGVDFATAACDALRDRGRTGRSGEPVAALEVIREFLLASFPDAPVSGATGRPHVVILVGVNGSGKTT
ncbi:MAG: signal recognition particle receptor subunit alpha, partial [Acidobacteriota bacterium]